MSAQLWISVVRGGEYVTGVEVTDLTSVARAVYGLLSDGTIPAVRAWLDPQEHCNGDKYVGLTAIDVGRLLVDARLRDVDAPEAWALVRQWAEVPGVTWEAYLL